MTISEYVSLCAKKLDLNCKKFAEKFGVSGKYKNMLESGVTDPSFQFLLRMEDECGIPITKISKYFKDVREHIERLRPYKGLPIIRTVAHEMKIDPQIVDNVVFGKKTNIVNVLLFQVMWETCKIGEKLPRWEADKILDSQAYNWIKTQFNDLVSDVKTTANGAFEFSTITGLYRCTLERLKDELYLFSAVYTATGKTSVKRVVRIC